ncbi:MAG: BON domain-containing protein, partial [Edaphobacter sp.]
MNVSRNLSISSATRTIAALALALSLTLSLAGCKSSPSAPTDDASLTAAVQSRIASDGNLSTEPIQSAVKDRVATLNGTVSNEAARALAAADVSQVAGIKTVVNNLTVQAPAPAMMA